MPKEGYRQTKEHTEKIRKAKLKEPVKYWQDKKLSKEHKEKSKKGFWWIKGKKHPAPFKKGKDNPRWRGGTSYNPYSVDWTKTLRRAIRERDNYTCQLGGELQGDRAFDVHHIDYDRENCDPENLITLCRKCHTITNDNREYWSRYLKILNQKNLCHNLKLQKNLHRSHSQKRITKTARH